MLVINDDHIVNLDLVTHMCVPMIYVDKVSEYGKGNGKWQKDCAIRFGYITGASSEFIFESNLEAEYALKEIRNALAEGKHMIDITDMFVYDDNIDNINEAMMEQEDGIYKTER